MIVMKFGGSSVGSGRKIVNAASLVKQQKGRKIVVLSAMGDVTDRLINVANSVVELPTNVVDREVEVFYRDLLFMHREAAEEAVTDRRVLGTVLQELTSLMEQLKVALLGVGYLEDLTPKSLDYIMSFGERLSVTLMAGALESQGVKAQPLTGYEAGIVTDDNFGAARPLHKVMKKRVKTQLNSLLKKNITPVVTGFVAADESGKITTLGRGGSDFTASLIGRYLPGVKEVQIWTDVDGILTTDPKMVPHVKLIPELSYVEAMDLAYFGAKVIHSKMLEPAMIADVPVTVLNTFNPASKGTRIVHRQKAIKSVIKAVAVSRDVVIITLSGVGMAETPNIAGRVFSILGDNNINIIMISGSSESNLSFVVAKKDMPKTVRLLKAQFKDDGIRDIGVMEDVSILTVVGVGMAGTKGIAAKVFNTTAKANVNIIMIAQGSSEVNISFMILDKDVKKALRALHKRFIE